jgi:hypothetical protein
MSHYQPPFSITPAILNLVVEIGELLGTGRLKRDELSPSAKRESYSYDSGVAGDRA